MSSEFDFNLDDIPVPGVNRRPRGLLRLPVPDDGPPGTSDIPLIRDKSPKNVCTSESPDGLKNSSRDSESLFTPSEDDQKQMKFSFSKSSVLGSELAKKRLQAFCLQKKQSNSCISPTSSKPIPTTILTSPVVFGNKFQSALKKMPTISKTNPLEECAEKAKNLPKKIYKKVTEYEKSRTTMTEILELKKEEERKLALIKLGVPLGLVPGNAPVKGLTPKPMPTKAMPPIKNFLDPQQVESLLKKADLLVNSDDPSFKFSLTDDKLFGNKYNPNNRRSHDRNNRSNKNRYSDNYRKNDRRHDRNDRDRDRRRRDSHSRSKHRDSSGSRDKRKHNDSISKMPHTEIKKPVTIVEDKKEDIIDNSEYFKSTIANKNTSEIAQIEENNLNFNHFSIESLNDISDEKKCEISEEKKFEVIDDIKEIGSDFKVDKKSQLIYDKFLKEKFVPFPSINYVRKDDDLDFNSSPKVSSELASKSFCENNKIDLYSPGRESSRESTPLLMKNSGNLFTPIPEILPENTKQIDNKKLDIYKCWSNIDKVCKPSRHSSSSCFRKTLSQPTLDYSENTRACICNSARREGLEILTSNIDSLLSSMSIENSNNAVHSTQNWYPRSNEVFQDVPKLSTELHSNWETDDSLSRPPEIIQTHKIERSDSKSNSVNKTTLNFKDLDIFSNNVLTENNSNILNSSYDENCVSNQVEKDDSKPPNSSLVSEYEKFMEAVCPQIGDEGNNNSYRSDSHSITQDTTMENSSNSKISTFDLLNSDDLYENKKKSNEQMFAEDERLEYFNIDKCETNDVVKIDDSVIPSPEVTKNNTTYFKTGVECWNSENSSEERKSGKYSPNYSSSKSVSKRKGHAKISSRRHKKKSKAHKNRHKSSSSSSGRSSSDSSSNSSTSTSSSSSSSSDNVNSYSSDTSSLKSSSDSSSNSDSCSDYDTSTSDSSISSDEKLLRSKKKIEKKIIAKAKKLVKKAERKKLRKMKKLIAQEKKEMHVSKEIMDEFDLKDDNVMDIIEKNIHIDVSKKSKKRKAKDKKNKGKHKKRKHSTENDLSTSSSDSEKSATVETRVKRNRDIIEDSHDYFVESKKKKNSLENSTNDSFDMKTLLNIKDEKVSDEEDSLSKNKSKESECKKSPYKQLIINASELQNSFLEGNKNNAAVKTEPSLKDIELNTKIDPMIHNEKVNSPDEIQSNLKADDNKGIDIINPVENNDIHSLITKLDNLDDNLMNLAMPDVNNKIIKNDLNDVNSQVIEISKNEIAPIETVQNDRRSDNPVKVRKERKASRWGSVNDREFIPQVNNSTLIEVPIQEFCNNLHSYNSNENVETDTSENKVYKIPTISSRNVISPKTFAANQNDYDNYPIFDEQKIEQDSLMNAVDFDGKKSPTRKISLDDRINMALQFQSDEIMEKSIVNVKSPEKGILIVGGSRLTRADPRITRTKKVSFADGFAPGQDSDCENEPQNPKMNQTSGNLSVKKKKKRSFSGHAYPCPETWPDYHPRWDRLPPPPPPPGSPPPELCDRTNFLLLNANTNSSPLTRIPRVLNAVAS